MSAALRDVYGNPSSIHRQGQLARQRLEKARGVIADFLAISPRSFVFTSGGTESNNLAIFGLVRNLPNRVRHAVTTKIEHPAVLECFRQLELEGVDVTYVDVDQTCVVDPEQVRRSIRPETLLVSVMHANNEVGTIQPIEEIGSTVRGLRGAGQTIFFHSDGVQALGKIAVHPESMGVDLYSVSAHKIFAPKGIGGLYIRNGVPVRGVQVGGRHERERRAGTENVPGAIAFARAIELCASGAMSRVAELRDDFEAEMLACSPVTEVNGLKTRRLPNTSNLLFRDVPGEGVVIALDMRGIAVSTGAACSSGSVEPSHVLLAMGRTPAEARSSVRFSLGRYQTAEDVNTLKTAMKQTFARLRRSRTLEQPLAV